MSKQYPGGIISKTPPVPTQSAASGVWTLDQQAYWQKLGQWPAPPNLISRSLRFNSADSAYLNRTPASASNRKTWTWSGWVKRSSLPGTSQVLFGTASAGSNNNSCQIRFNTNNKLEVFDYVSAFNFNYVSTQVFRDVSAWYHVVAVLDTTQATSSNRVKVYINGIQITAFDSITEPSLNLDALINSTVSHGIGRGGDYDDLYFSGYMTEVNFIDGQALTPSSFGYTDANTGVWTTLRYTGTYGTNGFYLNFSDNSNTTAATLGADYSGNGNNWTPNNFSVTAGAGNDSMVDTPTPYGTDTGVGGEVRGNYGTLNPIGLGGGTLSNGNLDFSASATTTPAVGTFALTTGKWYWEVRCNSVSAPRIGVYDVGSANPTDLGGTAFGWCLLSSPSRTFTNGSTTSYGAFSPTSGTIVMVAYDADAGKLWFGQDGTWFASGVPSTGTSPSMSSVTGKAIVPALANGNVGTDTFSINLGQRAFAYTAPSGFQALCTQNLPTPTIGATSATLANKYFDINLWTGNGTSQTLTNSGGFQPDWVWTKGRSNADSNVVVNAVTGANQFLVTESTQAEATSSALVSAFTSSGFSIGSSTSINRSSSTYVGWQWKANGAGSSNTAGSITSTVSANTTSGFSVVTYTGTGAVGATVGHGLGVAPAMIIQKPRSSGTNDDNWHVYHTSIGATGAVFLNATSATSTSDVWWNNTAPTSSVFTVGGSANAGYTNYSTATYVAYCFAPIAGYSAFGSYTGNGSTDGPFVYCGFRPAYVMVKRTSSSGTNWQILDTKRSTYNVMADYLYASAANAEGYDTGVGIDSLSNGFKIRGTDGNTNTSTATYIYMAFAESPFKYSLAR